MCMYVWSLKYKRFKDLNMEVRKISNHMPGKVWDEITYPFLNFNGATVEV